MSNEIHWGGINGKGLCKAIVSDIWMAFAVMVIAYLGLGIVGNMRYQPSYTSSATVAVYPFNQMYTLEASSSALETVGAVNGVFNSEMFRTGLNDRLIEPSDYSLFSWQIDRTFILMVSVTSSSPENAHEILRTALDYFQEISPHLVGDNHLEILAEPDFPLSASNPSGILTRRPLLTLLMGLIMVGFLALRYAMRKTFKTSAAIRKSYKNVRFFTAAASASNRNSRRNKKRSRNGSEQGNMRKTAVELHQMLRAKKADSIFITSAAQNESKTEVTVTLAKELAEIGRSVLILETDPEILDISDHFGVTSMKPSYSVSELLREGIALENAAAEIPDQSFKVIFVNDHTQEEVTSNMAEDVKEILEQAEKIADVILVEGCAWTGSRSDQIWREAADASLAVCRQDKADFFAIDSMITDLQENDSVMLGCVLYGF